jgi:hypothetical protein
MEDLFADWSDLPENPSLEQLEHLHRSLTPEQREELLECLLIAASRGTASMMAALAPWLLCAASQELIDEVGD